MFEFRTQGFNGYSTKYSPFVDSRLAVAAAANFGLVGNGRLYILELTPDGIQLEKWFDTQDALYDVAWSELHENQALVASGDGSIKLFDTAVDSFPVRAWHEHAREAFSVHWNLVGKDTFCSSSWDGTVKVWSPHRPAFSLLTLPTHSCTYSAQWSPHSPALLSAVSSDSHLRLFDVRAPPPPLPPLPPPPQPHTLQSPPAPAPALAPGTLPQAAALTIPIHAPAYAPAEALTHDWNKYREHLVAVAGVDRLIRTFDVRGGTGTGHSGRSGGGGGIGGGMGGGMGGGPLAVLPGHAYAVRRLAWSPHLPDVLLSASYDMTCRVWIFNDGGGGGGGGGGGIGGVGGVGGIGGIGGGGGDGGAREAGQMAAHTEFVTGVDWCLFGAEGWCASCAWDERVLVWDVRGVLR